MVIKNIREIKNESGLRTSLILAFIFFGVTLSFGLNRYYSFYATYDHGLFNQVFWNSIHGHLFQSSLSSAASSASLIDRQLSSTSYIHLGQHFVIDFLLWMPLYALFPSPVTLIVLQVILITVAGLVLYALARHFALSTGLSVMLVASYYGANGIIGPTLGNFYEHCQIPLFLFSLILALEKRCWWLFWLLTALTLGTREDTGITLFGIGVYLIVSRRYPRIGWGLCTISFSYVVLVTNTIMPLFSNDNSRLYLAAYFKQFIKDDRPSTLELLWAIISQPQLILKVFFSDLFRRVRYLLGLWLPLAFVPAISPPAWMMSSFPLLVLLLQVANKSATSINTRYALSIIPLLFYGAILWWSQHREKFKPRLHRFWLGCVGLSLIFTLTSNPNRAFYFLIPEHLNPLVYTSLSHQWQHAANLQTVLNLIPPTASVSTSSYIVPHLSSRREIIRLEIMRLIGDAGNPIDVDYAVVDLWQIQQPELAAPVDRARIRSIVPIIDRVLQQGTYGIVQVLDDIVLVQKGVSSNPQAHLNWLKLREKIQPLLSL